MSIPFRERNPVIIGAISLAVIAAADPGRLPGPGPAPDRRRRHLLRRVHRVRRAQGQRRGPDRRRPGRQGRRRRARRRPRQGRPSGSTDRADVRHRDRGRDQGQDPARRHVPLARAGRLRPARGGREIPVERTRSPYDVVEAFSGLAETSEQIDTDQLAKSLTTLADLTRNTPEEFRGALDGVSRALRQLAARDEQINTLLHNLERVSDVLDERDQDIVALMSDADVLFHALVAAPRRRSTTCWSRPRLSTELTAPGPAEPGRPQAGPDPPRDVVAVLNKNEDNLDNSLRLMAPFYRVFANTLGTGPWFDTYIQNLPPVPRSEAAMSAC